MGVVECRYSKNEFAPRGMALFKKLGPKIQEENECLLTRAFPA
jgi:hypothetical protein